MTRILSRPYDQHAADRLTLSGFLPPIARALAARGIQVPSDLEQEWAGMLPPAMLEGTREAAERLALARDRHEAVTIVADYDCDGATACAVGIRGLRMLGITANYFVPDRVLHGYGLTPNVVDIVAARTPKPNLIVTVDNGISSVAAVDRARELGIDVIITDHHLPGAELPRAQAIVNPNLTGSTFPSKNLAGVGVIYYVLLALRSLLREHGVFDAKTQPRLDALVDFVALGTVADVVKLDKNNRILVSQGIRRIRCGRTQGSKPCLPLPDAIFVPRGYATSALPLRRASMPPAVSEPWKTASNVSCRTIPPLPLPLPRASTPSTPNAANLKARCSSWLRPLYPILTWIITPLLRFSTPLSMRVLWDWWQRA